jgi:hypothetical protein
LVLDLLDEFYNIELSILQTAGQVHLAEPTDGEAVVDSEWEGTGFSPLEEGVKKFSFFDHSFFECEAIIEADVPVCRLEPHHGFYNLDCFFWLVLTFSKEIGVEVRVEGSF